MTGIIGQALAASKLIDYQEGAVVSKEIIRKEKGTVTLFAFDRGQGLSTHSAPFDAMVYILEGKVRITIAGKDNLLEAGQFIIMPANKPHALVAVERFKMFLIMIKA